MYNYKNLPLISVLLISLLSVVGCDSINGSTATGSTGSKSNTSPTTTPTTTTTTTGTGTNPTAPDFVWTKVASSISDNDAFYMSGDRRNLYLVNKTASQIFWVDVGKTTWSAIIWPAVSPRTGAESIEKSGFANFGAIEPTHNGLSVKETHNKIMILIKDQNVLWGINTVVHNKDSGKANDKIGTWVPSAELSPATFFSKDDAEYISVIGNFVQNTEDKFNTGPVEKDNTFAEIPKLAEFDTTPFLASTKDKFVDGTLVSAHASYGFGNAYEMSNGGVYVYINRDGLYLREQQP